MTNDNKPEDAAKLDDAAVTSEEGASWEKAARALVDRIRTVRPLAMPAFSEYLRELKRIGYRHPQYPSVSKAPPEPPEPVEPTPKPRAANARKAKRS